MYFNQFINLKKTNVMLKMRKNLENLSKKCLYKLSAKMLKNKVGSERWDMV